MWLVYDGYPCILAGVLDNSFPMYTVIEERHIRLTLCTDIAEMIGARETVQAIR
jgi:hypothetical protein